MGFHVQEVVCPVEIIEDELREGNESVVVALGALSAIGMEPVLGPSTTCVITVSDNEGNPPSRISLKLWIFDST